MSAERIVASKEKPAPQSERDRIEGALEIRESRYTLRPTIDRVSRANPANVMEVAASQLELMNHYHNVVIEQAQRSFRWALAAAVAGLLFLLISVGLVWFQRLQDAAIISLISGALVEFISALNFHLYGKTSEQLAQFHGRLDMTQRFLIANSLAESMEGAFKQRARLELVRVIAGIAPSPVGKTTADPKESESSSSSLSQTVVQTPERNV